MSNSTLESVSPDDRKKLETYIDTAKHQFQEIDDIRESLKDLTKHLAEELAIKPKVLMQAAKIAYKNNLADHKEQMDSVEDVLEITGNT